MAEKLKSFEFGSGAGSDYDWDKLLDGSIYRLEKDKDFQCKVQTFSTLARAAAKRRGKTLKTSTDNDAGTIVIQAEEASDEIKAKWAAEAAAKDEEGEVVEEVEETTPAPAKAGKGKGKGK